MAFRNILRDEDGDQYRTNPHSSGGDPIHTTYENSTRDLLLRTIIDATGSHPIIDSVVGLQCIPRSNNPHKPVHLIRTTFPNYFPLPPPPGFHSFDPTKPAADDESTIKPSLVKYPTTNSHPARNPEFQLSLIHNTTKFNRRRQDQKGTTRTGNASL